MATSKRFVAKNGLDNNNQTITNVSDPVNAQDAATKSFASNASNITSGNLIVPIIDSGYYRIVNPGGGVYVNSSGTMTGAIALTFPVGMLNTMIRMTIKIYEFATNESFEVHCGGYTYATGNTWTNNPFAYIIGNPAINRQFTVRFGYTSTNKAVVYIGELASTWEYPQIYITEVQCGYSGQSISYTTGWSISFQASAFENVTATVTNPQIGYATSTNTAGAVVLRDGSGNFTAGTITANLTGTASNLTNFTSNPNRTDGNDYSLAGRTQGIYAITGAGTNGPGTTYLNLIHCANAADVAFQIAGGYNSDNMYFRGTTALQNGTGYTAWRTVLHSGNCTSYASGSVAYSVTFNNSGSGDASGTIYNGSAARTISYNTIGASPLAGSSSLTTTGTVTSGTWSGSFGSVSGANLTSLTANNLSGTIPSAVLGNSSLYIGTTAIALNRGSGALVLTGITSIDGTSTSTYYHLSQDRNRTTMPAPNSRAQQVQFDFANASVIGGTVGSYAGIMTWAPYDGNTASTGDASYQIGVVGTAANSSGYARMVIRKGIDTTWNSWQEILTSSNIGLYSSGSVAYSVTFNNSGSGDSSGTTFNGSAARTISYNTIGASPLAGSSSLTTAGALTAASLTVTGNLTVNGTTVTVNSTTVTVDDPIITLGGDTAPTSDDSKDRGIEFRWHNGSVSKVGFFGFDDSTGKLTFIPDATNTSEVFSGTKGTIDAYIDWADVSNKSNYVGAVAVSGSGLGISNNGTAGGTYTVSSNATSANTASTIVFRDSNGDFSAGIITATSGIISANSASTALRVTQVGSGAAILVEDSANPDATPFTVDATGNVGIGLNTTLDKKLTVYGDIYTRHEVTDPANATHGCLIGSFPTYTGSESALEDYSGGTISTRPIVNTGHTNTGIVYGGIAENLRNYNTASSNDGGTLTNLDGFRINYGHNNLNTGTSPTTINAFGLRILPSTKIGTITNMYDLYLDDALTGTGTVTNRYGIYQVDPNKNYFAGNIGIGVVPGVALAVAGQVGLNATLTDPVVGSNSGVVADCSITFTGSETAYEAGYGQLITTRPIINSGHTNSGGVSVIHARNFRNFNGASANDNGTLDALYGINVNYGHYNENTSASPLTNFAFGITIKPYYSKGTITTMYDLYLAEADYTGGTVTNKWGIYQVSPDDNYLAGKLGIGIVPADTVFLHVKEEYTNPVTDTMNCYFFAQPTWTGTETVSEDFYGNYVCVHPIIGTGHNNSGLVAGRTTCTNRNHVTGVADPGTLANIMCNHMSYGHLNDYASSPITTNVHGLHLSPYCQSGTISNLYDIMIHSATTGGTLTNHWAIYQEDDTAKNYFAGNVGIGTDATDNVQLRVIKTVTDLANGSYSIVTNTRTVYTGNETALESYSGIASLVSPEINTGHTNSSTIDGILSRTLRNYNLAPSNDSGTLSYLIGIRSQYGHHSQNTVTPVTTNVYGLKLEPYTMSGTITNMYDILIGATSTGTGTVTNRWGIYQNEANDNYLAGRLGIGVNNPSYDLHVYTRATIGIYCSSNVAESFAIRGDNTSTGTNSWGVYGNVSGAATNNYGVRGYATGASSVNAAFVATGFSGTGCTNNYGVFVNSISGTGTSNYGIYAYGPSSTGTNNYTCYLGFPTGASGNNVTLRVGQPGNSSTGNVALLIGSMPSGDYCIYSDSTYSSYFAGNIGIGTLPTTGRALEIAGATYFTRTVTDPVSESMSNVHLSYPTYTGTESAFESHCATYIGNRPIINTGHTNSGILYGSIIESLRNYNGASANDGGTSTELRALSISYGNYNSNTSATPLVTAAYGIRIIPYTRTGTLTTMYDLYLDGPSTGTGTVTNKWGIYQEAAHNNYLAGSLGLGTTPVNKLDVNGTARFFDNISVGGAVSGSTAIYVGGTVTAGVTQYGILSDITFGSDCTTGGYGLLVAPNTTAATYTMASFFGVRIQNANKGANSSITSQYGVYIDALTSGSTNNYAIYTAGAGSVSFGDTVTVRVTTGTSPFAVSSTTKVSNLNVDKLDDQEGTYYLDLGNATGTLAVARIASNTITYDKLNSNCFGTTSTTACVGNDSRLSDSRTPTAHVLNSASHTVSGLTAGHFLQALTATTFGFAAHGLTYSDVGALAANPSLISRTVSNSYLQLIGGTLSTDCASIIMYGDTASSNASNMYLTYGGDAVSTGMKLVLRQRTGAAFVARTTWDNYGNFCMSDGTVGDTCGMIRGILVKTGTAPTSSVADCFLAYSADITAGNAAPHFRTEGGAVIKLYQGAAVADANSTSISTLTGTLGTTGTALVAATGTYASDYANLNANDRRLMDQVNNLKTVVDSLRTQLNAALARLRVTGGNGLIAD